MLTLYEGVACCCTLHKESWRSRKHYRLTGTLSCRDPLKCPYAALCVRLARCCADQERPCVRLEGATDGNPGVSAGRAAGL